MSSYIKKILLDSARASTIVPLEKKKSSKTESSRSCSKIKQAWNSTRKTHLSLAKNSYRILSVLSTIFLLLNQHQVIVQPNHLSEILELECE